MLTRGSCLTFYGNSLVANGYTWWNVRSGSQASLLIKSAESGADRGFLVIGKSLFDEKYVKTKNGYVIWRCRGWTLIVDPPLRIY